MTAEFVQGARRAYENIGFLQVLFSSPLFLAAKLFFFFLFTMVVVMTIGIRGGIRGGGFLVLFFLVVAAVLFVSIRSYQKFEKRSPVRRKVFMYRISQLVEYLASRVEHVESRAFRVSMRMTGSKHPVEVRYDKNLAINAGGIVGGVPLALPKRPHPKTFYFALDGACRLFEEDRVNIDFSARGDDEDPVFGYGVRAYGLEKRFLVGDEHVETKAVSPQVRQFMDQLRKAVEGTGLKGEIEFDHGRFRLKIFDTIRNISIGRGEITYRHYGAHDAPGQKKIQDAQTAFYGIERVFQLVQIS